MITNMGQCFGFGLAVIELIMFPVSSIFPQLSQIFNILTRIDLSVVLNYIQTSCRSSTPLNSQISIDNARTKLIMAKEVML